MIGLNESVKGALLREVCSQIAPVHSIKFHRHPKTKMFLGAASVAFTHGGHGRKAVGELDGKIVAGCYLRAELDDKGAERRESVHMCYYSPSLPPLLFPSLLPPPPSFLQEIT